MGLAFYYNKVRWWLNYCLVLSCWLCSSSSDYLYCVQEVRCTRTSLQLFPFSSVPTLEERSKLLPAYLKIVIQLSLNGDNSRIVKVPGKRFAPTSFYI